MALSGFVDAIPYDLLEQQNSRHEAQSKEEVHLKASVAPTNRRNVGWARDGLARQPGRFDRPPGWILRELDEAKAKREAAAKEKAKRDGTLAHRDYVYVHIHTRARIHKCTQSYISIAAAGKNLFTRERKSKREILQDRWGKEDAEAAKYRRRLRQGRDGLEQVQPAAAQPGGVALLAAPHDTHIHARKTYG